MYLPVLALTVYVDKRIMLGSLKKELEKYVGTSGELFKVTKQFKLKSSKLSTAEKCIVIFKVIKTSV